MKRVMVIGGPGSGKSYFARKLHEITGLPLFHLDRLYWKPGWEQPKKEDWVKLVAKLSASDEWIMDGGYNSSFHIRMPRADTIFWLNLPRRTAFPRVLRRIVLGFGRGRKDMAPGCYERLDWDFLKWAWNFKRGHDEKYAQALARHATHARIFTFARSREANRFLRNLRSSGRNGIGANSPGD